MRILTNEEIDRVAAGYGPGAGMADGAAIGTVVGYIATGTVWGTSRLGFYGGLLGASFSAGYGLGTVIYEKILRPVLF